MNNGATSRCPDCPTFEVKYPGIVSCPICGLGKTTTATRAPEHQDYLREGECGGQARPAYFAGLFSKYFRNRPVGRSLDIGCGRGEMVAAFERERWTAHGIDAFRGFQADGKRFFRADLATYEPKERYDVISLVHAFEHMPDPIGALDRVRAMLNPDGLLLLVVPNFGGVWSRLLGERWHMLKPEDHLFHYTPRGLSNVVERCGFQIQAVNTYSGYAPSPWQIKLAERRFYEHGIGARVPVRPIVFRTNAWLRPAWNWIIDRRLQGAEIQLLAAKLT